MDCAGCTETGPRSVVCEDEDQSSNSESDEGPLHICRTLCPSRF